MPRSSTRAVLPLLTLALVALAGCQDGTTPTMDSTVLLQDAAQATGRLNFPLARDVRSATARYHSTTQATKDGYAVASACVASPAGGMGFHWVNSGIVDPVFDPMRPEAVLYAPNRDGGLKLVAVEYIVVDVGQPAPMFGNQPFNVGGTPLPVPHWSLHVWLFRENPNGPFTPFNPAVTCPQT